MKCTRILQRLLRREDGATAVEFAIVSLIFFTLMFGVIEYGMIMFTKVAIESAVMQVSRAASIRTVVPGCPDPACAVQQLVQQKTLGLVRSNTVGVTANVVSSGFGGSPPIPDICLDNPANPYPATCPVGSGFINNNGVAGYQATGASAVSVGNAGDLVEIRVTYLWRVLFPMFEVFQPQANAGGRRGFLVITSSSVIKNEPF